jgi:hypothetical protein
MSKIGEGSLAAAGRMGLNELRQAVYTQSPIANQVDHGMYGVSTQGEIADARRDEPINKEEAEPSILNDRLMEASRKSAIRVREKQMEPDR